MVKRVDEKEVEETASIDSVAKAEEAPVDDELLI
jgi:hypothetical protein